LVKSINRIVSVFHIRDINIDCYTFVPDPHLNYLVRFAPLRIHHRFDITTYFDGLIHRISPLPCTIIKRYETKSKEYKFNDGYTNPIRWP